MKKKLLMFSFFLILFSANAQEVSEKVKSTQIEKNAVTLSFGFPGVGVGYARFINDHFTARVGMDYMDIDITKRGVNLSSRAVDVYGVYKANNYNLWMDYTPFKKSSFKLVGGVTYLSRFKFSGVLTPNGTVQYGDIVLPPDQVGDITVVADWSKKVAPYLGLGFGKAIPKSKIGFSIEFGGYFVGKSDFIYDGTKMLAPNTEKEEESHEIQDWVDQFTIMGNITFHANYKF